MFKSYCFVVTNDVALGGIFIVSGGFHHLQNTHMILIFKVFDIGADLQPRLHLSQAIKWLP